MYLNEEPGHNNINKRTKLVYLQQRLGNMFRAATMLRDRLSTITIYKQQREEEVEHTGKAYYNGGKT
jgi:hypothetical protein